MNTLPAQLILASTLLVASFASLAAGAIAKGQGTRVGFSHSFDNIQGASNRALAECGAGCKVILTFDRGCGAYSMDRNSGAYGVARAPNRAAAENAAMGFCRQYGGKSCYVRTWTCTNR